jgi:hypothetical protein
MSCNALCEVRATGVAGEATASLSVRAYCHALLLSRGDGGGNTRGRLGCQSHPQGLVGPCKISPTNDAAIGVRWLPDGPDTVQLIVSGQFASAS